MKHLIHKRVGEIWETKNCGKLEIIEYYGCENITIKFIDNGTIEKGIHYGNIKQGKVGNKNIKNIYNVGYVGQGIYTNKNYPKEYSIWFNMLERCYSKDFKLNNKSYVDCSVDDEWHNFQNFCKWMISEESGYNENYHLDKDLLLKNNKIYGPNTCIFVPHEINGLLITQKLKRGIFPIGVSFNKNKKFVSHVKEYSKQIYLGSYETPEEAFEVFKNQKEKQFKNIAEIWKEKIHNKAYLALINRKIEITD